MQLSTQRSHRRTGSTGRIGWLIGAAYLLFGAATMPGAASAQTGSADIASTVFYEGGGPLNMTVVNPSVRVAVDPIDELSIRAGWEADIVSGASVAVVDAPSSGVDIVSTASVTDFRNVVSGSAEVRSDLATLTAGYGYGWENDYQSHSLNLAARSELFERNTIFQLSYAHAWDSVCDVYQPRSPEAVERRRLDSSAGCFQANGEQPGVDRTTHDLALNTFQGSWTQAWAPWFATQVVASAQLIEGFQSNPYRAVWLGRTAAQEHHPNERARYAGSVAARIWLEPLAGALQPTVRLYRDTWDIQSVSAELAYEQVIDGSFRIRVRGRYYTQSAAAFFSDDYTTSPRGAYFTGDRELSAMWNALVGASLSYTLIGGAERIGGFMREFQIVLKGDWLHNDFPGFRYTNAVVPNLDGLIVTLALAGEF